MNPEAKVKRLLHQALKEDGIWHTSISDRYHSGLPDFIGCDNGTFMAWECKAYGKKLRPIQEHFAIKITKAGGEYYTITGATNKNNSIIIDLYTIDKDTMK